MGRPSKLYSQSERVLTIYDMLWRGLEVRAARLADRFEVSRRTCERDIAVLREVLGPRLEEVSRLNYKVYRIGRDYSLGDVSREQVLAYVCGAKMVSFLSGPHFQLDAAGLADLLTTGLNNGAKIASARLADRVFITNTGNKRYEAQPDRQEVLGPMLEALLYQRPIDITYLSARRASQGEVPTPMLVHPLTLVLHRGGAYFVVEILGGEHVARRLLALDRIDIERVRSGGFREYPADYDASEYFADAFGIFTGDSPFIVSIWVEASYVRYISERTWHPDQVLTHESDGTAILEFPATGFVEVSDWVLGMGENVEVLGPPEFRSHVAERLRRAYNRYAT